MVDVIVLGVLLEDPGPVALVLAGPERCPVLDVALLEGLHRRVATVVLQLEELYDILAVAARSLRVFRRVVAALLVIARHEDFRLAGDHALRVGGELAPQGVAGRHADLRARDAGERLVTRLWGVEFDRRACLAFRLALDHPALLDGDEEAVAVLFNADHREGWQARMRRGGGGRPGVGEAARRGDQFQSATGTRRAGGDGVEQQVPIGGEHRVARLLLLGQAHGRQS